MKTYVVIVAGSDERSRLVNAEDEVTAVKLARAGGLIAEKYRVTDFDWNTWDVDVRAVFRAAEQPISGAS